MFHLCQVKFFVAVTLFSVGALGAPANLQTQVTTTAANGSLDVTDPLLTQGVPQTGMSMQYTSPTIKGSWTLGAGFTYTKADYSNFLISNRDGTSTSLGDLFDAPEAAGSFNLTYAKGIHQVSATYSQSVGETPFESHSQSLNYDLGFFAGTTTVGLQVAANQTEQPESYFINRDLSMEKRPEVLESFTTSLHWEQIWTDRYKTDLRGFTGSRYADRPRHFGAELRQGFAVSSAVTTRLDLGLIDETHSEALKNERGYFSLNWVEAQVSYEPIYDLILTVAAGVAVEKEEQPDGGRVSQVGTDTWGLMAKYDGRGWSADAGFRSSDSNTGYHAQTVQGNVTWEL